MVREMKDSGVEWISEIPDTWQTGRLKAMFSFSKGLPITKDNLVETGIAVISYGQIHSKNNSGVCIQQNLIRFVSEEYMDTNPTSLVHEGDFIFADTSEDLEGCGNCVYVDREQSLFAGYHTIILRAKERQDNRYWAYLFKSDMWRSQIRSKVFGVKLFSISRKILDATSILIPPADEQLAIADFLDRKCAEIDIILDKTRSSIEEYKKLKQTIITQSVTKGIRGDRPMKDSGIEWIGEAPSHWDKTKVKWLLAERKDKSEFGNEEPLSMSQKYGPIPTRNMDIVPNMASSFVDAKLVQKQDLVFNKLKAHLGVFSVSNYDGLVSPDYAVYYSTGLADVKFLEYLFKTPQYITEFKKKSTGIAAGLTRLYTDGLYSIYCVLPPLDEQQQIVNYLNSKSSEIDDILLKKEQHLTEIEAYKRSLIYEYVTGKKEASIC